MALFKIIRCNGCGNIFIYPKNTRWKSILKTVKENGWLVRKTHQLCPECKFDLEMAERGE